MSACAGQCLQESSYYGDKIYNEYMIRLVKLKYEVIVETCEIH